MDHYPTHGSSSVPLLFISNFLGSSLVLLFCFGLRATYQTFNLHIEVKNAELERFILQILRKFTVFIVDGCHVKCSNT
jgi:hypothetical protein